MPKGMTQPEAQGRAAWGPRGNLGDSVKHYQPQSHRLRLLSPAPPSTGSSWFSPLAAQTGWSQGMSRVGWRGRETREPPRGRSVTTFRKRARNAFCGQNWTPPASDDQLGTQSSGVPNE